MIQVLLNIRQAFNIVAQHNSRTTVRIGEATQVDSAAMKTVSVLGLLFLPGTFISVSDGSSYGRLCSTDVFQAVFSTSFFNFSPGNSTDPQHWTVSENFWIYWAVAIPATVVTVFIWVLWQGTYMSKSRHAWQQQGYR